MASEHTVVIVAVQTSLGNRAIVNDSWREMEEIDCSLRAYVSVNVTPCPWLSSLAKP